jgi:flagellar FliJ protein
MGYQFKLEALRRYRKFQEDELQRELADALRIKEEALNHLRRFQDHLEKTRIALYRQQSDSTQGAQLAIYPRFLQRMTEKIALQKERVADVEKQCDALRKDLMEAVKKRKTLEKLKEKELTAYLAELSHEEQKFINEMAINRFNLRQL